MSDPVDATPPETDSPKPAAEASNAPPTRDVVSLRVKRFATLRAAHRALAPSSSQTLIQLEAGVAAPLREKLRLLAAAYTGEAASPMSSAPDLAEVDAEQAAYRKALLDVLDGLALQQLRSSLSGETHVQRVEVTGLLRLCLEAEPQLHRYICQVDFLITLLCASLRDGRWVVDVDPLELNDEVVRRGQNVSDLPPDQRSAIAARFDEAARRLELAEDPTALTRQTSSYKREIALHYFVPEILSSVVRYNIAARNHWEDRARRGREVDARIDDELGLFAPLLDEDPRSRRTGDGGLPAHEAPGVLAVQQAICERLSGRTRTRGFTERRAGERVAASLDLESLTQVERQAMASSDSEGPERLIRMAVVLGHMSMVAPEHGGDLTELGIHESQLDVWVRDLSQEVRREIDSLVSARKFEGAERLGDIESRFLRAVRVVVKRRPEAAGTGQATRLLRQQLSRQKLDGQPPLFMDLLGGGWARTAVLGVAAVLLVLTPVVSLWSSDPREVSTISSSELRRLSPVLETGYRDHAANSVFVGLLSGRWGDATRDERRKHADILRDRLEERGVRELVLVDAERVVQAHWRGDRWVVALAR